MLNVKFKFNEYDTNKVRKGQIRCDRQFDLFVMVIEDDSGFFNVVALTGARQGETIYTVFRASFQERLERDFPVVAKAEFLFNV